jgi:hypothetical protein
LLNGTSLSVALPGRRLSTVIRQPVEPGGCVSRPPRTFYPPSRASSTMGLTASSPIPSTSSSTLDQLVKPSASTPGRSMMTSFGVPFSIIAPLDPFADSARAARTSIIAFLRRAMSVGYLEVHEGSEVLSFGRSLPGCNIVRLLVTQGTFWTRVFHSGDLGCSSFLYLAHLASRSLTSDYSQRGLHDGRSPHRRERPRLRDERTWLCFSHSISTLIGAAAMAR